MKSSSSLTNDKNSKNGQLLQWANGSHNLLSRGDFERKQVYPLTKNATQTAHELYRGQKVHFYTRVQVHHQVGLWRRSEQSFETMVSFQTSFSRWTAEASAYVLCSLLGTHVVQYQREIRSEQWQN